MLSKIHINNKYFVLFVLGLLGFAAIKAMQGLANIDSTSHNNTNFIYVIIGVLSVIYILSHWRIAFANNIYTKTICSFLAYLILRYAFFYDDTPIIRLIANCVWPIIAVLGYTIGYKNYTSENLSAIARVYLTFIVPFFVYNVFLSFTLTYDTDEFAKDAFFICLIFLPYIFLLKSPKWKYILYIIFAAIAFISTKRTILIATILSGVLFFLKTKRADCIFSIQLLFLIFCDYSKLCKLHSE